MISDETTLKNSDIMTAIDIDEIANKLVSGESSCCPYLNEMAEKVRNGQMDISEMKSIIRASLNDLSDVI